MSTYNCQLNLNDGETRVLTIALEMYIREYDQKNLLQPWNRQYKDLARGIRRRLQSDVLIVDSGRPSDLSLETERRNSRPATSAHTRHNQKKKRR